MKNKKRRIYGKKLNFKSISCAPVNELGVVYLFGVLQDVFDLKIESIQSGYPDCIARRKIAKNRWEELQIEFEFKSSSFKAHKHDPDIIDIIICWEHNWTDCPKHIEIIELSKLIEDAESIKEDIEKKHNLNEYQLFCREKRLAGLTFAEISKLWKQRTEKKPKPKQTTNQKISEYNIFAKKKRLEGLSFKEISVLWKQQKNKKA